MNLHEFHQFVPCPFYPSEIGENSRSSLVDIWGEKHRRRRRQVGFLGGPEIQTPCDPDVTWGLKGRETCQLPLWGSRVEITAGRPRGAH